MDDFVEGGSQSNRRKSIGVKLKSTNSHRTRWTKNRTQEQVILIPRSPHSTLLTLRYRSDPLLWTFKSPKPKGRATCKILILNVWHFRKPIICLRYPTPLGKDAVWSWRKNAVETNRNQLTWDKQALLASTWIIKTETTSLCFVLTFHYECSLENFR